MIPPGLPPGSRVRVRADWPEAAGPVHVRTPHYLRGRTGELVRHLGDFPNPEDLAFARPAPAWRSITSASRSRRSGSRGRPETICWWRSSRPGWNRHEDAAMTIEITPDADLLAALRTLLDARGIASAAEIAERIALTDAATPARGAAMVARAWTDPDYRTLMLTDGAAAAEALGIPMRGAPPLGVLEDTAELHHLVVCTLCSCYPRAVLGYPPFWFKSAAYRARAVRDPRGLLAEWGTVLPEKMRLRVVDSTADYRWMVLPLRPAGTAEWDAERLAGIVRETDMIGVTLPAS